MTRARAGLGLGLLLALACGRRADSDDLDIQAPDEPPSGCPLPVGSSEEGAEAIEEVNRIRARAGLGCVELIPSMASAAERHCGYYVANAGDCVSQPHRERRGCDGFRAETFGDRLRLAGYGGHARFEVMAYVDDGRTSVRLWLDSVWHRLPILSPDVDQGGYGAARSGAVRCDTIDFGVGASGTSRARVVQYPHDGQLGVPRAFAGRELPEPPPPPGGWPSGYPITLYAAGVTATGHTITVDGSDQPLDHVFLAPGDPRAGGLLVDEMMLYTFEPLAPATRYRVRIDGHRAGAGGDAPVRFEWTFTTR